GVQVVARLKRRLSAERRFAVPGAHVLTDVAAEDPVPHARTQVRRDRLSQLDGQVADAAPGVQLIRTRGCLRGASIDASRTGAAVVGFEGLVRRKFDTKQQRPEEEEAAEAFVEQHGVLAEPAEPCEPSEVALQQRSRVHDGAPGTVRCLRLYPGEQLAESLPEN